MPIENSTTQQLHTRLTTEHDDSEQGKGVVSESPEIYQLDENDIEYNPPQNKTTFSLLQRLDNNRKKNWFRRNFSPISKGGIRGSVLTLFSGTVGAGVLSLPKVLFQNF